ncbi:MAG: protein arginine kinase [Clostridiales bacterium]|nr:protein arginine kinase [Clostridiales bacterium]
MSWLTERGPTRDVIISSRVRLARNIKNTPFPVIMDRSIAAATMEKVYEKLKLGRSTLSEELKFMPMEGLSELDRQVLLEKHLVSLDLIKRPDHTGILLDSKEEICIMLNEEDHIRLQAILPGNQIRGAYDIIDKVDDLLEKNIEYAYDENLGYLTSCPTNVGTGMRASVMMHLPGLVHVGHMNLLLQTISKIGLTARGIYGEGSEAIGHIFQMSNQVTLGPTESDIITNLEVVVKQVIEKEKSARRAIYEKRGIELEDSIYRSLGILKYAKRIGLKEFMSLLSQVRLGVTLGIIKSIDIMEVDKIMVAGQPANVNIYARDTHGQAEDTDISRAEIIKDLLARL